MRKRVLKKISVLGIAAGLFVSLANAQSGPRPDNDNITSPRKGSIQGKIVEERSGIPMEYTSVALYRMADSSLVDGTVTSPAGIFTLEDVPFGEYYIVSNFVGYEKKTVSALKLSSDNKEIDLGTVAMELNTQNIGEVEIIADQRRVEYKLDKKVVNVGEDLNAAGGSAVDVLENTPSVSVDIEGNVTLRGSGSFTVLINGKPTVLEGSDALQQIPASTIRNIEIITNPSVKYDPDGNAGIINVVLKEQVEKGITGVVNASVGRNNKYRLDALINRRNGKLNYFFGGNYNNNLYDGTLDRTQVTFSDIESYNVATGDFDFTRKGTQLKAGISYDINEKSSISLEGSGGTYGFGIDRTNQSREYTVPASEEIYFVNRDYMFRDGLFGEANLSFSQEFDQPEHNLQAMFNFSYRNGEDYENQEYYQTDASYDVSDVLNPEKSRNVEIGGGYEVRGQVDYVRPLGENSKLEAGYQARIDSDLEEYTFQEFDQETEAWVSIADRSSDIDYFRNIQSVYAMYSGMLNQFQYQLGIRGEYTFREIRYENFNSTSEINRFDYYPTVHIARQFKNDHQLMASYSKRVERPRGYFLDSIPSYVDRQTVRIGNPRLEPEYVNSIELGYQKGWGQNFLAYELFYRNTTNLISRVTQFDEEDGLFYQRIENINEDHSVGSEIMLNWQFTKWLKTNASVSGYYYQVVGELFGEEINNSSLNWSGNLNTTFTLSPTARFQANAGYRGPTVTPQGRAEGFAFVSLAARMDFFDRKLSATLQVSDLFGSIKRDFVSSGEGFEQYVLMRREPRVVMLSLSYRINNYRPERQDYTESGGNGMGMDGGF
jgi:outer membrane receptor protein involved in Fe transport